MAKVIFLCVIYLLTVLWLISCIALARIANWSARAPEVGNPWDVTDQWMRLLSCTMLKVKVMLRLT